MGLSSQSTGICAAKCGLDIKKCHDSDLIVALAGNPNVGKSTVFNQLTGLHQHTGNWTGKTVSNAMGECCCHDCHYILVDIPGTYSLSAHSAEEEVARDFICFGGADSIIVVCDATNLERNINLVLQIIEVFPKTVVCLNLMDEAKRRNITINVKELEKILGVPVVATTARHKKGLSKILEKVEMLANRQFIPHPYKVGYPKEIENAIKTLEPVLEDILHSQLNARFTALKLIEDDKKFIESIQEKLDVSFCDNQTLVYLLEGVKKELLQKGLDSERIKDRIVSHIYLTSESICNSVLKFGTDKRRSFQLKVDKILTGKWTGLPVMLLLLAVIFWITIVGANYPSELISTGLFWLGDRMAEFFTYLHFPVWLNRVIVEGIYRVLAWVVSVMLPPMAIFFPLFTLLEDLGYLPRLAFNLDNTFKKCNACGKQALTMWIGKAFCVQERLFLSQKNTNNEILFVHVEPHPEKIFGCGSFTVFSALP